MTGWTERSVSRTGVERVCGASCRITPDRIYLNQVRRFLFFESRRPWTNVRVGYGSGSRARSGGSIGSRGCYPGGQLLPPLYGVSSVPPLCLLEAPLFRALPPRIRATFLRPDGSSVTYRYFLGMPVRRRFLSSVSLARHLRLSALYDPHRTTLLLNGPAQSSVCPTLSYPSICIRAS